MLLARVRGRRTRSTLRSVAVAVVLVAVLAPAALAAEPTPAGPFDGQLVEDPTFVSGGALPTQPPGDAAAAPVATPRLTPPPTDTAVTGSPGDGSPVPLLLLALTAAAALVARPRPVSRRRIRRD